MIEKIINIKAIFLFEIGVPINLNELLWALNHNLFTEIEIINFAIHQLELSDDDIYLELASLSNNELFEVRQVLEKNIDLKNDFEKSIQDKWLYIVLAWLFKNRTEIEKPLDKVELIYSDFDYPEEIKSFVQYMPTEKPLHATYEENINQLFSNWHEYLIQKKEYWVKLKEST